MLYSFAFLPSVRSLQHWSGGNGIFITLIRSHVLDCPFEVWFPVSSCQERILGTADFLLLFLCICKFSLVSFLFFCFTCLCFPLLSKPASLPHTGSPPPLDHYHPSIFLHQHLRVIFPFSLLCLILSILPSFFFHLFLKLFSALCFWLVLSGLSKMFFRLLMPLAEVEKSLKMNQMILWDFVQSTQKVEATLIA